MPVPRRDLAITDRPSAIDAQNLSCAEPRLIGKEEDDGGIEIRRLSDSPAIEWLLGGDEAEDRLIGGGALGHRRLHQGRREHVETDVLRRVMRSRCPGEPDN